MKAFISSIEIVVFVTLAGIHFYWAMGGKAGAKYALPTNELGVKVLNPIMIDCVIVGVGFLAFGTIYLNNFIDLHLPKIVFIIGFWFVPSIFLMRAIGYFKYVGFFKKIRNTTFAKADTKFFSPFYLLIGGIGILIPFFTIM